MKGIATKLEQVAAHTLLAVAVGKASVDPLSASFAALLHGDRERAPDDEQGDSPSRPASREEPRSERQDEPKKGARAGEDRTEAPGPCAPPVHQAAEVQRAAPVRPPVAVEPPLQQLADQMLRGVSINQLDGQTTLRLELSTPRLCRVGLDLRVEAGRLTARFQVPDLAGRELLRAASRELERGLQDRGIGVASILVELEPSANGPAPRTGSGAGHNGDRSRDQRQPEPEPRHTRRHKGGKGFVL